MSAAEFTAKDLRALIKRITTGASADVTRFHLNGVDFERRPDGMIRTVTTDGHRMHLIDMPWPAAIPPSTIVPLRAFEMALLALRHCSDTTPTTIALDDERITITTPGTTLTVGAVKAQRVSYRCYTDRIGAPIATVDRDELRRAVRKTPTDDFGGVMLEIDPGLDNDSDDRHVWVVENTRGKPGLANRIAVDAELGTRPAPEWSDDQTPRVISPRRAGYSQRYLDDALTVAPKGPIAITMTDSGLDPIAFAADGFLAIVMPLRLD